MTLTNFVPLAFVALLVLPFGIAHVHGGTDRLLTRLSIYVFGGYVDEFQSQHPNRQDSLRAAHFAATYREYGTKTMTYATAFAVVGSVVGIYLIWAVLLFLSVEPEVLRESLPSALEFLANLGGIPQLSAGELFVLFLISAITLGVMAGGATYWIRWWYPSYVADNRARQIEATLPSTVAFLYALSRSGMELPRVIQTVSENADTYGAAAEEFEVAVRNTEVFGTDVTTAIQQMGRRTASTQFREFTENLVSVLQSGHSLSAYLERQYHDFQEESESQQKSILDLLATLAEAYVTVLVAGPLFLITILVVIGISLGDTIDPLEVLIYVILPFGNLAFIIYLSMVTESINPGQGSGSSREDRQFDPGVPQYASIPDGGQIDPGVPPAGAGGSSPDGGHSSAEAVTSQPAMTNRAGRVDANHAVSLTPNQERLRIYERLRSIRRKLASPNRALLERPERIFWVTLPIAVLVIGWAIPTALADGPTAVDDVLIAVGLFLGATYAVVYERYRLRIGAIEAAVPDLLDRLASVNEAGTPIVNSIDRVRQSNMGVLDDELDRVWGDIEWGADLETALYRFEGRVRTRAISRVVTLLTEAMQASGNLATVLRIAARQAIADRRLERERRQAMTEYMVVVYVSFLVFLFIIAVLSAYLLPNLPTETVDTTQGAQAGGSGLDGLGDVDTAVFERLFYHAAIVQGTMSGLIAGQLSTGDIRSGTKHAVIMVTITVAVFALVL